MTLSDPHDFISTNMMLERYDDMYTDMTLLEPHAIKQSDMTLLAQYGIR